MSEIVIATNGLSRDYGSFRALDKVDISIKKDRIIALLGPNGAGKTTFLHLLMGLLEPTEGNSSVLGSDSRGIGSETISRIGYMGDGDEPPRWMTIGQLIKLQAGSSKRFDSEYVKKLLSDKELALSKPFGSMSKGQKKWLRAGLLLASKPELLILDEPAEGLDPSSRHELYDYLREYITESGATAIVTTHIIGDIERIADDVAIINKGKIMTYACLEDLRDQVCEIHVASAKLPENIESRVKLIGTKKTADGTTFWVKRSGVSEDELKDSLESKATVRYVDLQTYYLAITENGLV